MEATEEASKAEYEQSLPTRARLLVEVRGALPQVVLLAPGATARVGRDPGLEVALDDAKVSRVHAVFAFDGSVVTVRDPGSRNGTFVGTRRVPQEAVPVEPGSVVRIGEATVTVVQVPVRKAHGAEAAVAVAGPYIAEDPVTVALLATARRVAASALPVLVQGETGVGKEGLARMVHEFSERAAGPFVAVNCATLSETLAESALFGHEKGAFTGAVARKAGVFEAAHKGTLFLDEVGELSGPNQARLLRVLQEQVLTRVGSTTLVRVDVRVVAATNTDLPREVAAKRFREDLYFRLGGAVLELAPLRARPRDVLPLARHFLAQRAPTARLTEEAERALRAHRWPGNVRELRNAIDYAVALGAGDEVRPEHLPAAVLAVNPKGEDSGELRTHLDEVERKTIRAALDAHGWNQSHTARALGLPRRTLVYKMERLGLKARSERVAGGG